MRQAADASVEQAKTAFAKMMEATEKAIARAEGSVKTVGEGAGDLNRQAMAYVEENMAASFDLARRIAQARTVEEVAALQQEFIRRQIAAAAEQGKGIAEMMARSSAEAMRKGKV
ncbi:MAG TPA: phasin family protein [Bauldia sp.]|nr:phasin family protein [Bauldia sp.]